jgi:PPOX class probable F420-dependent enzyme
MERPSPFSDAVSVFLDRPLHAVLATHGPSGAISQSVVWFARDDDSVWVSARPMSVKVRHLRADPRSSLLVLSPHGGAYVRIEGHASVDEVVTDALRARLVGTYLGADARGWLAANPLPSPNALIRLHPERVVSRGI